MAYYFIITTSAFIEWSSSNNSDISNATRKLFDELKKLSSTDKENKVVVTECSNKCIREVMKALTGKEDSWAYKFLKEYYDPVNNYKEDEIGSVVSLAVKKANLFDKVIIINGSNIYDSEAELNGFDNIEVLNEKDALEFVVKIFNT